MQTGVKLSSKNIAMIKYIVALKTKQLCDLLQFEDETKIKRFLIAFVDVLKCEPIDKIIEYVARINMDITFNFHSQNYLANRKADDDVLSGYLESKNIEWHIKADKSDFYDEALLLKSQKINKSALLKIGNDVLISKLEKHLFTERVTDGTILDMLMHIKYLTPSIQIDVKGIDEMTIIEQVKLGKAMSQLSESN